MLCANFNWICPSASGEEDENVKSLQTNRRMTEDRWENKISVDVNCQNKIWKVHIKLKMAENWQTKMWLDNG